MMTPIKILILDTGTKLLHGRIIFQIITENAPTDSIITSLKVTDNAGHCTNDSLAKGLVHALTNNYDIVNISLGLPNMTTQVDKALKQLKQQNTIVVASSGNNKSYYPAKHPDVISVGSYDPTNTTEPAEYTKSYQVLENGTYSYKDKTYYGTSFACAYYSAKLAHQLLLERTNNNGKEH